MTKIVSSLKWFALLAFVLAISSQGPVAASDHLPARPKLVMIIRHAEKPDDTNGAKDPNLTPKGFERAKALAKTIPEHFPRPDFLIAAKKSKGSNRPVETITPLAKALDEPIDSTFKAEEINQIAHAVSSDAKYAGKVVLICWHHEKIPDLAKALGVTDAPAKWNSKVFDQVWEITYDGDVAHWKQVPEEALPGDSQN
jgi:phosphohistidine phosphatase SixA